ncbi:hypothetical protein ACFLXQ_05080 [Chloroflexota bacterium]
MDTMIPQDRVAVRQRSGRNRAWIRQRPGRGRDWGRAVGMWVPDGWGSDQVKVGGRSGSGQAVERIWAQVR